MIFRIWCLTSPVIIHAITVNASTYLEMFVQLNLIQTLSKNALNWKASQQVINAKAIEGPISMQRNLINTVQCLCDECLHGDILHDIFGQKNEMALAVNWRKKNNICSLLESRAWRVIHTHESTPNQTNQFSRNILRSVHDNRLWYVHGLAFKLHCCCVYVNQLN